MQKRNARLAIAVLATLCLIVAPVYAATSNVWVANDFKEANYTVHNGYAIFDKKLTMIPSGATNVCTVWSNIDFDEMKSTNYTKPSGPVYVYLDYYVDWRGVGEESLEILLKNSASQTVYFRIIKVSEGYRLSAKTDSGPMENTSAILTSLPNKLILGYTGDWFVVYDANKNVITSVECGHGVSTWVTYGFKVYYTNSATINAYAFAGTLATATQGANISSVQTSVTSWIPIVFAFVMLGIILSVIKKASA
jgi:hypothetical protein